MSILRPYQKQAIKAINEALSGDINRVAVEMATGLGKTITFAAYIDEWLIAQVNDRSNHGPTPRALVLVHTDELVRQAVDKIRFVTRGRWTIGVVKAERDEVDADVIVASVQTLAKPGRRERISDVGLIVVDECHHATAPSYVGVIGHFHGFHDPVMGVLNPIPVIGFTATLSRSDGQGLGQVWQDLAFSRSLPWAIRNGWLVDLVPYTIMVPGVDAGASDAALDAQLAESLAPEAVVSAWVEKAFMANGVASNRYIDSAPSTVLFAPLVRSAQAFADAFNDQGVKAEVVHGGLPSAERQAILARYEAGVTTVICNAMVLTEGWDSPRTSCVIITRLTKSIPLFIQMVGRGMRVWLSQNAVPRHEQRCLLLCVAGTTQDLVTVADLSDRINEVQDGKSLLAMEDEWDLGKDIEPDEDNSWNGPVRVQAWDAMVQRSSKAWTYTNGGVPFLPTNRHGRGYVFIVETAQGWEIWYRETVGRRAKNSRISKAPDLELAMAYAEDTAQDLGGDMGALLADKTRPWRKQVPSQELLALARRAGVSEQRINKIMTSKTSGKAGRLSDLVSTLLASNVIDPAADKIRGVQP